MDVGRRAVQIRQELDEARIRQEVELLERELRTGISARPPDSVATSLAASVEAEVRRRAAAAATAAKSEYTGPLVKEILQHAKKVKDVGAAVCEELKKDRARRRAGSSGDVGADMRRILERQILETERQQQAALQQAGYFPFGRVAQAQAGGNPGAGAYTQGLQGNTQNFTGRIEPS